MHVTISSCIFVKRPSKEVMAWAKKNLVIANPEYAKKSRMNLWLGDTPKELRLYEMRGDVLVLPFGVLWEIKPLLTGAPVTADVGHRKEIDYKAAVPLFDYQQEAVAAMKDQVCGILQSPAGSGKTQMGIALAAELGLKTLWLTHTHDLLKQSKERAELYMDPSLIGTITAGKVNIGRGITFATIQTMARLDLDALKYEWDVIIADECHHCAGTPTAVTQFSRVLNRLAARRKYGLSATVHRADGLIKATYALLGRIVYDVPREAVASRIMPVTVIPVGTDFRMSEKCLNTDGTLNYTGLIGSICEDADRNYLIASYIHADKGKSSLILSDRLAHLEAIMALLPFSMQNESVMLSGKMTSKKGKAERDAAIADMRSGKKKYLFATYALAKEGLDIPRLERLYLATPQKDKTVVTQAIGRVARVFPGKEDPVCYDFVDNTPFLRRAFVKRQNIYSKSGNIIAKVRPFHENA